MGEKAETAQIYIYLYILIKLLSLFFWYFFATTGFILRHWLVVTKIAGCDILNFLVVVTDYADGFGSYINIYTAGKSGTALLLLRLAFLQNSLQGMLCMLLYRLNNHCATTLVYAVTIAVFERAMTHIVCTLRT